MPLDEAKAAFRAAGGGARFYHHSYAQYRTTLKTVLAERARSVPDGWKGIGTISMKKTLVDGERNRALAILAENPDGCTRAVMLGRGFPLALIASLIRAGARDRSDREAHPRRS